MSDRWMPKVQMTMSREQFLQLPRHPAYQYDYVSQKAILTPKTVHYHAMLDLTAWQFAGASAQAAFRPMKESDFDPLTALFSEAFRTIQPFAGLDDDTRRRAAFEALDRARSGGDGPWIAQASVVALQEDKIVGGIIVTLLPRKDPCDWDSYFWSVPPPPDCIEQGLGRPHLTWIFTAPFLAGQGIGTSLLNLAVGKLRALGYQELLTTFVLGNHSSMLWHWRNGFRLLTNPASARRRS